MKIKMLKDYKYSPDGINIKSFLKDEVLEMSDEQALHFVKNGAGKEEKMMSKPENKMIKANKNKRKKSA